MPRVLFIVGDFVEDYEVMAPFQMLAMLGYQPVAVCPDKQSGDTVATAIHDFEGHQTYSEKRGHQFLLNGDFDAVDAGDFAALVIPGGRAPEYLRVDPRVLEIVRTFHSQEKPIAATCHGAQVLAAADVIRGRRVQAYPACRPECESAGADWDEPSTGLDSACVDSSASPTLITAPAWPANAAWMRALADVLGAKIEV